MKVATRFIFWTVGVLAVAAAALLLFVHHQIQEQVLSEAGEKARLILDRNLATHTFFSHSLKPHVFSVINDVVSPDYFDPTWMSSTFAVRGIDEHFKRLTETDYYYKECAIDARSPLNEADSDEKDFIQRLNTDPALEGETAVKDYGGESYYVVLRRGEVMERSCLRCHSQPQQAPAGMIDRYGSDRSFNRKEGDVVSAISIRIPVSAPMAHARSITLRLFAGVFVVLLMVGGVMLQLNRFLLTRPLKEIRMRTALIATSEENLGKQMPLDFPGEWCDVARDFNSMSSILRKDRDNLEDRVRERTNELEVALAEVQQLSGILPICANCKKIRDDKGYWQQVEGYIQERSNAQFSHGICPRCVDELYPEIKKRSTDPKV